jgi:protein-tyrosine phosphatase
MLDTFISYINAKYGSKRGLLNFVKYKLLFHVGFFRRFQNIEWSRVERVIFICSGNICRSPVAELFGRINRLNAISAGVDCANGIPADFRAARFAVFHGHDLSLHKSTNINQLQLKASDLVIGMEPQHLRHSALMDGCEAQISLLGLWGDAAAPYIHDPFNAEDSYFTACSTYIMGATARVAQNLTGVELLSESRSK